MKHHLPQLDFASDALQPFLSSETLAFHHGKHHKAYVAKLNAAVEGKDLGQLSLTELVKKAQGGVFNNAAQHYNHSFYWRCIEPGGASSPEGALKAAIDKDFGSLEKLRESFSQAAATHFGSGWCWLVKNAKGRLEVVTHADAGCPVTEGATPLLTCDVWEHAYYIDYRNVRPDYIKAFWKGVNWDFVASCLAKPDGIEATILGTPTKD